MIGLVADVAEGFSVCVIQISLRIVERIGPLIIAKWRRIGWRGMVKYIMDIHTEIDALAFGEFDVFAHSQVQSPASRTGERIRVEVASYARLGLLEHYHARVARKSKRV